MLMIGIEANDISFLFLHRLQPKNSKNVWIYTSEEVSYLLSAEFARGTENWGLLFSACGFDNFPIGIQILLILTESDSLLSKRHFYDEDSGWWDVGFPLSRAFTIAV